MILRLRRYEDPAMGKIKLWHSVHKSKVEEILKYGLKAVSEYDNLGIELRRNVIYCWLRKEHNKLSSGDDYVYLEVTVDEDVCRVAEMDFASLAIMYRQGSGGRPNNEEAARLLAEVYRVTSVPIADYIERMFSSPEVLVKEDIEPNDIRLISD